MVSRSGQRIAIATVLAACFVGLWAPQASAQSSISFSGGASIDPEQVYAGVAWESPDIGGRFRIRPGIDGGFGDGIRLGTINLDLIVKFPLGTTGWTLVQGGGPVITDLEVHRRLRGRAARAACRRQLPVRLRARQRVLHRVPGRRRQLRAAAEDGRRLGCGDQVKHSRTITEALNVLFKRVPCFRVRAV